MTESQDNTRDEQVSSVLDDASAPTVTKNHTVRASQRHRSAVNRSVVMASQ